MRWSNEMFYILLLNSFAGAIAYGFWMIAKSGMAKKKKLKYVYPMLGIVEAFFIFPVMFAYLNACSGKSWIILWNFIFADTVHLYGRMFDGRDMGSRCDILFRKLYQGILEI